MAQSPEQYLASHRVEAQVAAAMAAVLRTEPRPADPVRALGHQLVRSQRVDSEYAESVRYIFSNADFSGSAKRYQNPRENWDRFDRLLQKLGQPQARLKVVHIAGTNGKGTTSALCDAMLRASTSSASVGLFTSPHLHSFRERIRINGQLVSKKAVVEATHILRPAVEEVGYASPFEKLTALALLCFTSAGIEWAVLETGLGGRWDCTNHSKPLVCGITRIGLDHMNVLGNTVEQIAGEKAGILKEGIPSFSVPQQSEAQNVLMHAAKEVGTTLTLCESASDDAEHLPFWLSPLHQQHNAKMAFEMMQSLAHHGHIPEVPVAWKEARNATLWPARFELVQPTQLTGSQRLILDVAHNEPAVQALVSSVAAAFQDKPVAIIFGANHDKDVHQIARILCAQPRLCMLVAVQSSHPKAVPTSQILSECKSYLAGADNRATITSAQVQAASSMLEALALASKALNAESPATGAVLCCGSVFVAADMRSALAQAQPHVLQPDDWAFTESAEPPLLM